MCEFKVFLDSKKVAEDIIYARVEDTRVILKDILGKLTVLDEAKIDEVNVISTQLILSSVK